MHASQVVRTSAPRAPARAAPAGRAAHRPGDGLTPEQQDAIDRQHAAFNFLAAERAELLREAEVLRAMAAEQRKLDDEFLKKLIALI